MITAKGIGFLVAAVILYLLARVTQVGWLYLVDAVLWGLIMLSVAVPWLSTAFLAAQRRVERPSASKDSPGPVEGEPLEITLTLHNRSLWPSYVLSLFYESTLAGPADRLLRFFVTHVARSGQVSMLSTVQVYQRGMHTLGPVVAESSAPFGLFRRRVTLTGPQRVLVYPLVIPLRRLALAGGLSEAAPRAHTSRTGADSLGSRQYLPGDARRLIHWRNTARAGRLMVKELEDPLDRTLYLLFDATHVWGEGRETTLEYGIKVVASVAHYAHLNRVPVRAMGGGLDSERRTLEWEGTRHVPAHWPQFLKSLASVAQGDGLGLTENLPRLPPVSTALVVVSAGDIPALQAISNASSPSRRLAVVLLLGFGEPEPEVAYPYSLRAARIPVVPCRPGQIREALQLLQAVGETLPSFAASAAGANSVFESAPINPSSEGLPRGLRR